MSEREAELESLLAKILAWTEEELTPEKCERLNSYTHAEDGYREARSYLLTLVEEHLTNPDRDESKED